ncbi:MAG: PAS domain-containing protein [Bacteroidales bacterium]|nr:PAS domain-containing protein [Bacteroidales bacterium]
MRLKFLFAILTGLLLATFVLILYQVPNSHSILIYFTEGIIALILLYLFYFYRKAILPYHTINNGMELLKEQDFSTRLRSIGQPEADKVVDIFNRMIDQLKNERLHVREQNHFLDLLIDASPMGVIIFDFDWHIRQCNNAALSFLDYNSFAELSGKKLSQLDSQLAELLEDMKHDSEKTVRLSDGSILRCSKLSFLDQGFAHPFVLIESLTAEVMIAEKKAYEKVIRMIAHEVNNTTAGITSTLDSVQTALEDVLEMNDLRDVIGICIERCYRMSHFITNFANVVKIPEPELQEVDLNEEMDSCKRFTENLCNEHRIVLHWKPFSSPLLIRADASLLEQVILNIVKNSVESIGEDGHIYISLSNNPIQLEIADTGKGIDKETENKLFTPFFSTKPNGQGLGLIFIREVLTRHHCTFSLKTNSDGMTRFKIRFEAQ